MSDEQKQPEVTDTAPDKGGHGGADTQTFTQDQVNAIVGERARRASESAVAELLKTLGVENVDGLKALLTEAQQRKEAEMTEAQKAQAEAEKARKEAEALKAALDAERQQRIADRRNARLVAAAHKAGMEVPDDIIVWAQNYAADKLAAVTNDAGDVDEKAVEKLIAACKEARASWFKSNAPGTLSNADGRLPKPDSKLFEGLPKLRL